MTEIEDLVLLFSWGIVISLGIVGFMLSTGPSGGAGPTSFESIIFASLKWAVLVAVLLSMYQLWRKHKRKEKSKNALFVPSSKSKQVSMVIRGANWTVTLHIITVFIFLTGLFYIYLALFPQDPLCNGIYALNSENLSADRIQCIKSAVKWLVVCGIFYYFFFREKQCQILPNGFEFISAIVTSNHFWSFMRFRTFITWQSVAKVSVQLTPRAFKVAGVKLIFYAKPGYSFQRLLLSFDKLSFNLGYVSLDEINRIKETLSQYVLLEVQEDS